MKNTTCHITETVKQQAAAWLARRHSNLCTETDERELQAWLGADPSHAAAFEALTDIWDVAGAYPRDMRTGQRTPHTPLKTRRTVLAGTMLVPVVAASLIFLRPTKVKAQSFVTGVGESKSVGLPDGSHIQLDTSTHIGVLYSQKERKVTLQYGRANFKVVADKHHPFIVEALRDRLTTDASNFDMCRKGEQVSVVMFSGQAIAYTANRTKVLMPGERLQMDPGQAGVLDHPDLAVAEAWHHGHTIFDSTQLSKAIAEMNRYSSVKIKTQGPHIGNMRISGVYRNGDNIAFANAVAELLPAHVVTMPGQVLLIEDNNDYLPARL